MTRVSISAERIAGLDGLRGIAAVIVVLSHCKHVLRNANAAAGVHWDEWLLSWPVRLLWGGDEALIGFFVLSGFVSALPFLRPGPPGWWSFACRRMTRLYPAYFMALLLAMGCAWILRDYRTERLNFLLGGYPKPDAGWEALLGYALLLMDLNDVNPSLWALVQAMRVACVFPILFAAIQLLGAWGSLLLSAGLSVAVVAISARIPPQPGLGALGLSFLKTVYFLFFFVLGAVLAAQRAKMLDRLTGRWRDARLALAVIGVGLLGMKWYLPYLGGPLAVGLGFAVILLVMLATSSVGALLQSRVPRFFGEISYSLFLVHLPVLYAVIYGLDGLLPMGVVLLIFLPVAVFVAWIFWRVIERPALGWAQSMGMARSAG